MIADTKSYDMALWHSIRPIVASVLDAGEWTRSEILESDEAAQEIIARLPADFRDISSSKFRKVCNKWDKVAARRGGFPRHPSRASGDDVSGSDVPAYATPLAAIKKWDSGRSHKHSEEYCDDSPERIAWRAEAKRKRDYMCVCCGEVRVGELLQVHHYNYQRLGREDDCDVCVVCSPETGMPCHMLLDLAREIKGGKVDSALIRGLFEK